MNTEINVYEDDAPKNSQTFSENFELGVFLGRIQAFKAVEKTSTVFGLSQLAEIKDRKLYRTLKGNVMPDGTVLSGTWDDFCKLIGRSRTSIEEMLLNHELFTSEAAEALESSGVSVRQMRRLRSLSEDDKAELIEAVKSGDKDQLLDLAERLIAKHNKEKAELNQQLAESKEDLTDAGKRINNMNAELERKELHIEKLSKKKTRITKFEELTEDVRDECMHLQAGCELNLTSLQKLFKDLLNEPQQTPESQLRLEQVYVAISVVASRAFLMLEEIRELTVEFSPERIQGQHILTPEEAERWVLDYPMLENKHNADKAARELKRDLAKPRKPGRPEGSKNKAAE